MSTVWIVTCTVLAVLLVELILWMFYLGGYGECVRDTLRDLEKSASVLAPKEGEKPSEEVLQKQMEEQVMEDQQKEDELTEDLKRRQREDDNERWAQENPLL